MPNVKVLNMQGAAVGEIALADDVFGVEADSFTDRAGRRVLSPVALVRH